MTDITELAQRLKLEVHRAVSNFNPQMNIKTRDLKALVEALEKAQAINAAAEKLVRCKGRYHSELNYRALAALFGVNTPDLPPLEHENVHYADAAEMEIAALRQRIAELEARAVTPVTYSENADADHCRKWAWEQVKGEVTTEEWTSGDNANYFGFFCWGWDMRRQYNEQRPVTVKIPYLPDDCDRTEAHYKYQAALRDAGIKVEAE